MSTPDAGTNGRQPTQTELEMEAGRKALQRYTAQGTVPPKKTETAASTSPFLGETVETGFAAALSAKQEQRAEPPKKPTGTATATPRSDAATHEPEEALAKADPTGLVAAALEAAKAPKVDLVVPKSDHLGRSRIYRNKERPNLYHYRDDFYNYEGGHYVMVDDCTIEANLYSFLDKCRKEVVRDRKREVVPFEPDTKTIHETTNALKAVGHVLPTIEQPYWLDGRTEPDPAQLICFPNGILNLSTNEFTPPDPMLFTPHGVDFDYDPMRPNRMNG